MGRRLAGRVAFVTVAHGDERAEALAAALVAEGTTVVLVAAEPEAAGRLAANLGPGTAVFCPGPDIDGDVDTLVELAAELAGRSEPLGPP